MNETFKLYYKIEIRDTKTGKLIRKGRFKKSHSFVLQWLQGLNMLLRHTQGNNSDNYSIKDISNTARTCVLNDAHAHVYFALDAGANDDTHGIIIGTGTNAPANTDYAMQTKVSTGGGSGQMLYGAHIWNNAAVVGSNVDMSILRPFVNNSGGSITLKECGIYIKGLFDATYCFCIIRDAIDAAVGSGQTATITYLIRTTA